MRRRLAAARATRSELGTLEFLCLLSTALVVFEEYKGSLCGEVCSLYMSHEMLA